MDARQDSARPQYSRDRHSGWLQHDLASTCLARGWQAHHPEIDAKHAEVARSNIARAGLASKVELRLGKASDSLAKIEAEKCGPFDLIFIDADKPSNPDYFQWALKLSRPGSLIIVDNVVRDGEVINAASTDASVQGVRRFNEMRAAQKR